MTLPADVRINIGAPFPTLVIGSGFIAVSKVNGYWTIGPAYNLLGQITNPNAAQKLVAVYDLISGQYSTITLSALLSAASRVQRSITASGQLPITGNDSILNINAASDLTPVVPLYSTRNGAPLTFKNLPGSHTQTLTRTSPDTIDGATTFSLTAGSSVTLVPYNDGVNAGWAVDA